MKHLLTQTCLLYPLLLPACLLAQTTGEELLTQLESSSEQLRQVNAAMADNMQTKEELRVIAVRLNEENEQLDQLLGDYNSALDDLNSEIADYSNQCAGQALSDSAFAECESWRMRLEDRNTTLTRQSEQLSERETSYSAQVDDYNAREAARNTEAQQLISRYDEYETDIDSITGELLKLNPETQNCLGLALEEQYQCIASLWE